MTCAFLANFKVDLRIRFFRIWACAAVAFAAKILVKDILREFIPRIGRKIGDPIRDSFSLPLNETQLPSLSEIFTTPIFIKDQLPSELWPMVREEYDRLLAAVNCISRPDAWDPLPVSEGGRKVGVDCPNK